MKELTCAERVQGALDSRMADLKAMFRANETDNDMLVAFLVDSGIDTPTLARGETYDDHTETLEESATAAADAYGLGFDYVTPDTFGNDAGYWRYQISYGGPSEELRFYSRERADFVLLDWFDGATRRLCNDEADTAAAVWEFFDGCGSIDHAREEAEAA